VLTLLGEIAFEEGRPEESIELLDRSAARAKEIDWGWWQKIALQLAAEFTLRLGRPDDALPRIRDSLVIARTIQDRQGLAYGLTLLAWVAAGRGQAERAGRLWGAVEGEAARGRIGQWESEREEYASHVFAVAGPEFERSRADGRSLSLDEAAEYALSLD
jgi:hypothetical protein